ncbi:MAG TPA: glycosyltransferase, partial [bacterium]|nr:glycosyltransferase [bacterium]
MDKDTVNLSVVIPAYNEENTIEATLYNINEYFEKQNIIFEIVVVDDGSCDETSSKVKSIAKKLNSVKLVSYKENKGKGE